MSCIKGKRGQMLTFTERNAVLEVLEEFLKTMNKSKAVEACSKATGRSPRIIYKLAKEKEQGALKRPKHTRRPHIKSHSRVIKYKSDLRSSIRRIVHSCLVQSIPPVLTTILDTLNALNQFPVFKKGTLYNLLKDIGFKYERRGNTGVFVENEEIISYRHKYLQKIKETRIQNKTIIYTGELWIDTGKIWQQSNKEKEEERKEHNCNKEVKPVFILVHAGTINGFIEGAKLTLMRKTDKTDVSVDMDRETYENWFFNDLIPNCPSGSVIVMDEAKYNSRKVENIPNSVWPKDEIIQWLENEGMEMSPTLTILELLELVNSVKDDRDGCKLIDSECEQLGIEVLRLPQHHRELSPIFMVWNQVEHFIQTNIFSYEKDLLELINESYDSVTSEDWRHYLTEVQTNEDFLWQANCLQENVNALIKRVSILK